MDDQWGQFASRLARVLAVLPAVGSVMLETSGERHAQFVQDQERLLVEVTSNHHLEEEFKISAEDETVLVAAGWGRPFEYNQWGRRLEWPAPFASYQQIADDVVVVFRDLFKIDGPQQLSVSTWVRSEDEDVTIDVTSLGIASSR